MLGWALLGGAAPPPPLMLVLAVVVVAADIEPTEPLKSQRQLTVGVAAHDLSSSLLSSPPPTSLNQPLSNTNLRHIVGLAEVVGMQRRWFCGSGRPQEWILECRRSLLWGLGEELLWSRNSSDFWYYQSAILSRILEGCMPRCIVANSTLNAVVDSNLNKMIISREGELE
ncbi:hypothetical protein C8R43DRAFT_966324 [Mycena crocata]|nr:hypothetical protein C8R43DRAFT_966324 [Mycena crocata]